MREGGRERERERQREQLKPGRGDGGGRVVGAVAVLAGEGHVERVVVVDCLERIEHFLVVVGDRSERVELSASGSGGGGSQVVENVDVSCGRRRRERIVRRDCSCAAVQQLTGDIVVLVLVEPVSTPVNNTIRYDVLISVRAVATNL